jgi:predicted nucleic acid-binding protein
MTIPHLYDAGALIALDRNDRRMWARYHMALQDGRDIHVPSVVVGQAWRDARRQVRLGQALAGCRVHSAGVDTAKAAGVLCGRVGKPDLIDAVVVTTAVALGAVVWTSDPHDIAELAGQSGGRSRIAVCPV